MRQHLQHAHLAPRRGRHTYQRRTLSAGSSHDVLKNFPTEVELRQALRGLATNVRVGFLPYFWVLTYVPKVST